MVSKSNKEVTIPAPIVVVPDHNDKPIAVYTDNGEWINNTMKYLEMKKWPVEKITEHEGEITIRFSDKNHAIMFCLDYDR